jgi:hypothetical protein
MSILDVFKADGYSVTVLLSFLEKVTHKPMRISQMGLFTDRGIESLTVNVEERSNTLALVPNVARGAPATVVSDARRVLRNLSLAHLPQAGAVMADELQGIRAFGSETVTDQVDAKVQRELQIMVNKIDVTIEWMKIGALKGLILQIDQAGTVSTLYNLFTEFNVVQQTIDMALSTTGTDVPAKARAIIRLIEDDLGAAAYERIHCFCGADLIDALLRHGSVTKYVVNHPAATRWLEDDLRNVQLRIGNVYFEEFRGRVGGVDYIESDEAFAFPVGVPGMWECAFGPANYIETVNTPGKPYYAKQRVMDFDKGIAFESQSNPLPINNRPRAVIKLGLDSAS